jgi:Tol biopolymer transport system component
VSPDGTELAYVDDTDRSRAIFVVPATGGTSRLIADVARDETVVPQWSPDGTMLAFASGGGLYVVDREGDTPREIARLRQWDGWSIRWSPDGQHLAALGWENPSALVEVQNHVFVVSVSGGEVQRLTPDEERQYKQGLEWHPGGQELTYMYQAPDFEGDGLRTAYVDGRPSARFIDEPRTWDYVGTWAPDASAYYFMASRSDRPGWQLYRRDSETETVVEVSAGDGVSLPQWSRDGTTMAWSVERVVSQLWVMEEGR